MADYRSMEDSEIRGFDHVQLLCPTGGEDTARTFWSGIVGLQEVPKPAELAGSGGVWFRCGMHGLHIGIAADFHPARRAHPAIQLANATAYDDLLARLIHAGIHVEHAVIPVAERRMKVHDPFGNLVEFVLGSTG